MSHTRIFALDSGDISVFGISAVVSSGIVLLSLIKRLKLPQPGRVYNVQNIHITATPRLGGIAIFAAVALMLAFTSAPLAERYGLFVAAASVLFFAGLAEDCGISVSPRMRLLASISASLLVIIFLDVWLPRVDLWVFDSIMAYGWFGIPFTILITAGIANAFNLIDGLHGLSSGVAAVSAAALSIISDLAGYEAGHHLCLMLCAAVIGFFIINYPLGLIFLGDSGAYTLGFVLAWFGVAILLNSPDVGAWAIMLTMLLPACDVVLSIVRRSLARKPTGRPDRMHAHHIVYRSLRACLGHSRMRNYANPLATLILLPCAIVPAIFGIVFWNQPSAAFMAAAGLIIFYGVSYFTSIWLFKTRKLPGMRGHWVVAHRRHKNALQGKALR
jgi:UDP-GlcNAc:undecaprenyl-phosphate/decaprenyl-phosphate GlcNAc-1-phosphate transferase